MSSGFLLLHEQSLTFLMCYPSWRVASWWWSYSSSWCSVVRGAHPSASQDAVVPDACRPTLRRAPHWSILPKRSPPCYRVCSALRSGRAGRCCLFIDNPHPRPSILYGGEQRNRCNKFFRHEFWLVPVINLIPGGSPRCCCCCC